MTLHLFPPVLFLHPAVLEWILPVPIPEVPGTSEPLPALQCGLLDGTQYGQVDKTKRIPDSSPFLWGRGMEFSTWLGAESGLRNLGQLCLMNPLCPPEERQNARARREMQEPGEMEL